MTATTLLACLVLASADGPTSTPSADAFAALGADASQDLVILGETRPILIRLRVMIGERSFRSAWTEAIKVLHTQLDRNGDGKLTPEEAESGGVARLVTPAGTTAAARGKVDADVNPKDGAISVDELAEVLRMASGPFRVQVDGLEGRRTDALFDHFDRDKDGQLTRPELASLVGMLRRLDRDDNELIATDEVAAAGDSPSASPMAGRPARDTAAPPAVELTAGESPLRMVRLLLKKYDVGSTRGPGKLDSRLTPEEFAIPARTFARFDTNGDGLLAAEELRGYVAQAPRDAIVDVALSADATGKASARVRDGEEGPAEGFAIRQLAEGVVEIDLGPIRIDIHVDDGATAADSIRRTLRARFDAADANQDGYLEEDELTQDNGQPSPLAGLFPTLDRDGDGKLYPRELDEYVTRQSVAARGRLTLTASNQGRALFGLLDLDRDRQLGAREVLDTFARVSACDRDHDGRISPDEIPHHIQLSLTRGDLLAILAVPSPTPAVAVAVRAFVAPPATRPAVGPAWFRKMDRNHDGDVSRREFLGTREQFDRLDRDHDGLIGPDEAEAARPVKGPGG